jgi:glycerol-3-phosphate dehydrogenase
MTQRYSTDIALFGGGIAGLWLLKRLRQAGYHAMLFESKSLGGGQTLASQGIIHGGLKYALGGSLTGAANTIAGMPARWRQCLAGTDSIDISDVEVLHDNYYMWSESSFRSRLKTFLGSKSLVGKVEQVQIEHFPACFAEATTQGSLYKLPDFVINTDSLIRSLARDAQDCLFLLDPAQVSFRSEPGGGHQSIGLLVEGSEIVIDAQRVIFCAGEGNAELIEKAGLKSVRAQTRPLNMVYLRKQGLPQLFVHCIGDDFGLTPRLTVTTHDGRDGNTVWYLGGELAESGVSRSDSEQIAHAQALVGKYFPWVDVDGAEWNCFAINRAEADINNNYRPDGPFLAAEQNIITVWPTKLTLSPALADSLVDQLAGMKAGPATDSSGLRQFLPEPPMGVARWD